MNAHVINTGLERFEAEVIIASNSTPILLDFWAEWCGPCKQLGPVLEKLAAEYNGAFVLAKVDVDAEQQLAGYFQIKSIPTVVLMKDGKIVDGFPGALSEGQLREFLKHHQIEPAPAILADVEPEAPAAVDPHNEVVRLRHAVAEAPEDAALKLELALALTASQAYTEALALMDALPANLAVDDRVTRARARIDLAAQVKDAPSVEVLLASLAADPADAEALRLLGLQLIAQGQAEAGLEHLLQLFQHHRNHRDGLPRTLLIEAFNAIDDEAVVRAARRKMASLLH